MELQAGKYDPWKQFWKYGRSDPSRFSNYRFGPCAYLIQNHTDLNLSKPNIKHNPPIQPQPKQTTHILIQTTQTHFHVLYLKRITSVNPVKPSHPYPSHFTYPASHYPPYNLHTPCFVPATLNLIPSKVTILTSSNEKSRVTLPGWQSILYLGAKSIPMAEMKFKLIQRLGKKRNIKRTRPKP